MNTQTIQPCKPPQIVITVGGRQYRYDPMQNITSYEVAKSTELLILAVNHMTTDEERLRFLREHNLLRHFIEV